MGGECGSRRHGSESKEGSWSLATRTHAPSSSASHPYRTLYALLPCDFGPTS